jgi:hypothetical protein
MPDFYGCWGKFVWPDTPPKEWEANWDLVLCGGDQGCIVGIDVYHLYLHEMFSLFLLQLFELRALHYISNLM